MNFSPFGSHFPGAIPGIHQFSASGAALVTSASSQAQDTVNRYHSNNINMPHFNQPHPPILGKFRGTDDTNLNMNKYNGHTNQYPVAYTQQSDANDNKRILTSYPQTSSSGGGSTAQVQAPEISQDLCNAILQQQNDAKRGWFDKRYFSFSIY